LLSTYRAGSVSPRFLWPVLLYIQLAFGVFTSSLRVKDHTKSWETHERNQEFAVNENTDTGKSQRLQKECNARINNVSATKPEWAKIIVKVRI
jgi:hypothetical protein